jgi:hypothetical protein
MNPKLIFIFVGLALSLVALPVHAGDFPDCDNVVGVESFPADGAVDVPLNPMLVLEDFVYGQGSTGALVLLDPMDAEIPTSVEWLTEECVPVFKTSEELEPTTVYSVWSEEKLLLSFTTGTSVDDEAPEFELGADEDGPGVVVSFVASDDVILITGTIQDGVYSSGIGIGPSANGLIEIESAVSLAVMRNGTVLDLTAHDRAGNFTRVGLVVNSPFEAIEDVDEDDGCTDCQSSLSGATGATALWLIPLLGLRRRLR